VSELTEFFRETNLGCAAGGTEDERGLVLDVDDVVAAGAKTLSHQSKAT
jgi:hypothetical protein